MNKAPEEEITWMAEDLAFGRAMSVVCPKCGGGSSRERSMSIMRYPDGLGWICFRASCGYRGRTIEGRDSSTAPPAFVPNPYTGPLTQPEPYTDIYTALARIARPGASDMEIRHLGYKYGLRCDPNDGGLQYFELRDVSGRVTGACTRRNQQSGTKLIKTYRLVDRPLYGHYPAQTPTHYVWLVEDVLSAIRVVEGAVHSSAVALFGTRLLAEARLDIISHYGRNVTYIVALDPGAEDKASLLVEELREWSGCTAFQVLLPEDLHRMSHTKFHAIINNYAPTPKQ